MFLALPLSAELTFRVRHDHLWKSCTGELRIDERGVSFREINPKAKRPHAFAWTYADIQQLSIAPGEIRLLTYADQRWKLGTDGTFTFFALTGAPFEEACALLKGRLDQRLVAQLADAPDDVLWELPVKHLTRFGGSHGVLIAAPDRLIYRADRPGESRTWRLQDIDNVSTSGPFQLTVTTFERARSHYGSRKGFNFQLKEPLSPARYDDLWRRLHPPALPALAARASVDSP
jgi:hypothetical protein